MEEELDENGDIKVVEDVVNSQSKLDSSKIKIDSHRISIEKHKKSVKKLKIKVEDHQKRVYLIDQSFLDL